MSSLVSALPDVLERDLKESQLGIFRGAVYKFLATLWSLCCSTIRYVYNFEAYMYNFVKLVFAWLTYKINALPAVAVLHLQIQLHVNELQNIILLLFRHIFDYLNFISIVSHYSLPFRLNVDYFILINVYDSPRQSAWLAI